MDNVTHALAGCLLAAATCAVVERGGRSRTAGFRGAAFAVGVIGAELPDADLAYAGSLGMGKLGYLLHHRGYTHTVLFAVVGALMMWGVALLWNRQLRTRGPNVALLCLALVATLSHLALDYGNNYGIHPFWPLRNTWYYGDAIFIVEPWLWIAALPPLYFASGKRSLRILWGALLGIILIASWLVPMVGRGVALAFLIGAAVWIVLQRRTRSERRIAYGLVMWCAIEAIFFVASGVATYNVRKATGPQTFRAVAITPTVGNPFCFSAQIMRMEGPTYSVSRAEVAPFPAVYDVMRCLGEDANDERTRSVNAGSRSRSVAFNGEWNAPRAELLNLVETNCEIAAAMRFIRVPQWEFGDNGAVTITDVRFGQGGGGFAGVTSHTPPATCPTYVPPWTPPRTDILGTPRRSF